MDSAGWRAIYLSRYRKIFVLVIRAFAQVQQEPVICCKMIVVQIILKVFRMKITTRFIALLLAMTMPLIAEAVEVDVTSNPDRSFFEGYRRVYKNFDDGSECSAMHASLRTGKEIIALNYLCKGLGITKEKVYSDLLTAMKYVKDRSSVASFAQYFDLSGRKYFTDEPQQFCIDTQEAQYSFLDAQATNKPGWKYLYKNGMSGGRLFSDLVGFWRVDSHGVVIAETKSDTINVDMSRAHQCGTVPFGPNLLLPAG